MGEELLFLIQRPLLKSTGRQVVYNSAVRGWVAQLLFGQGRRTKYPRYWNIQQTSNKIKIPFFEVANRFEIYIFLVRRLRIASTGIIT